MGTTKFSPAMTVFGRQMRDGLPVLPGHYNPHTTWRELLDHREAAMAKRHVAHHEAWSEHTTRLPPLTVGMKVFVQNQVGNKPRRWDKTGTFVPTVSGGSLFVCSDHASCCATCLFAIAASLWSSNS